MDFFARRFSRASAETLWGFAYAVECGERERKKKTFIWTWAIKFCIMWMMLLVRREAKKASFNLIYFFFASPALSPHILRSEPRHTKWLHKSSSCVSLRRWRQSKLFIVRLWDLLLFTSHTISSEKTAFSYHVNLSSFPIQESIALLFETQFYDKLRAPPRRPRPSCCVFLFPLCAISSSSSSSSPSARHAWISRLRLQTKLLMLPPFSATHFSSGVARVESISILNKNWIFISLWSRSAESCRWCR